MRNSCLVLWIAYNADMTEERVSKNKATACPTCQKPVTQEVKSYPFCSARCRSIDLAKWIDGKYVISRPIEEADLDQGE